MKKNIVIGATILTSSIIFFYFKLTGQNNLQQQLNKASAYQIYGIIDSAKVSVFSKDSLIQEGISEKEIARWQSIVNASNVIIKQEVNAGNAPKSYLAIIKELNAIQENMIALINTLHTKAQTPNSNLLSASREQIESLIEKTGHIMQESLNTIKEATKPPASWTNRVSKNIDTILGDYQKFFDQFKTTQAVNEAFVIANLSSAGITDPKTITKLVDALEQYIYRSRIKWWQVHRRIIKEKHIKHDIARQLVATIRTLYPDTVSLLDTALFGSSQDKASIIIFAQAGAYNSVCKQLLREIG